MSKSSSQRAWCFTCFNTEWGSKFVKPDSIKYLVAGTEQCPSTGKWHYQGYAEFTDKFTRKQAQGLLMMPEAHLEPRFGSRDSAREYCIETKERHEAGYCYNEEKCKEAWEERKQLLGEETPQWKTHSFIELGDFGKGQGKRSDIAALREDVKGGANKLALMTKHDAAWKFSRAVDEYKLLSDSAEAKDFEKKTVYVYWGPPGTNKSRRAREEAIEKPFVLAPEDGKQVWWDGYDGQTEVIIDDYKGEIPFKQLLRILDGYPVMVQVKGGTRLLVATRIWITSNHPPNEWYAKKGNWTVRPGANGAAGEIEPPQLQMDPTDLAALMRRITNVVHMVEGTWSPGDSIPAAPEGTPTPEELMASVATTLEETGPKRSRLNIQKAPTLLDKAKKQLAKLKQHPGSPKRTRPKMPTRPIPDIAQQVTDVLKGYKPTVTERSDDEWERLQRS